MVESEDFRDLMESLNKFEIENEVLIRKCKQIRPHVEGMANSCAIAKNVIDSTAKVGGAMMAAGLGLALFTGRLSLIGSAVGGVVSLLGKGTSVGTDATQNITLIIFCSKIKPLAQQRDKRTEEINHKFKQFVDNYCKGPIKDLMIDGKSIRNGLHLNDAEVFIRVNGWNNQPSVEDILKLIKDLKEDMELIHKIKDIIPRVYGRGQ